jgi:hypothetical protein
MNDDDLIAALRESFTDVRSATPVEQIVSRSRVIRARRRIPVAVAAVAVAAAAGSTAALIPSGPSGPAPVAMQTTAYVVSHVTQALDAMPADTVVVIQRTGAEGSDTTKWDNGKGQSRLEAFTQAGQPVWDDGIAVSGSPRRMTRQEVYVDYQNKTWWRAVQYLPGGTPAPTTVWTCSNDKRNEMIGNPYQAADQLRTALSCGQLKVVGSGTVGGVATVKLSGDFDSHVAVTYWVNATTYVPFRFTLAASGGLALRENLQWLPPTPANLARVNVPIPAGFTQVQPGGQS